MWSRRTALSVWVTGMIINLLHILHTYLETSAAAASPHLGFSIGATVSYLVSTLVNLDECVDARCADRRVWLL